MINIEPIEAFSDNYIWLLTTNEGSIVIDPGESQNLLKILKENNLNLKAILITHHHFDHTGGINEILSEKSIDVYGPNNNIDSINIRVANESKINLLGIEFEIIEIPGHTLDHIAYYSENNGHPILFCGDTLFAGGCGRVFEGTFEQMHDSLSILKNLPLNTRIYCGHEYTESNLKFAKSVELNGTVLTKMDGTAHGGIVFALKSELNLPVYFIGLGEELNDLQEFEPREYINSLLGVEFVEA